MHIIMVGIIVFVSLASIATFMLSYLTGIEIV